VAQHVAVNIAVGPAESAVLAQPAPAADVAAFDNHVVDIPQPDAVSLSGDQQMPAHSKVATAVGWAPAPGALWQSRHAATRTCEIRGRISRHLSCLPMAEPLSGSARGRVMVQPELGAARSANVLIPLP